MTSRRQRSRVYTAARVHKSDTIRSLLKLKQAQKPKLYHLLFTLSQQQWKPASLHVLGFSGVSFSLPAPSPGEVSAPEEAVIGPESSERLRRGAQPGERLRPKAWR